MALGQFDTPRLFLRGAKSPLTLSRVKTVLLYREGISAVDTPLSEHHLPVKNQDLMKI